MKKFLLSIFVLMAMTITTLHTVQAQSGQNNCLPASINDAYLESSDQLAAFLQPIFACLLPEWTIAYDKSKQAFTISDQDNTILAHNYLDNLLSHLRNNHGEERVILVENYVQTIRQTLDPSQMDYSNDVDKIYPVLRPYSVLQGIQQVEQEQQNLSDEAIAFPFTPINDDMAAIFVIDLKNSVSYVLTKIMQQWGIDTQHLGQLAMDNLQRYRVENPPKIEDQGGIYQITWDGFYESSLFFDVSFWNRQKQDRHSQGELIAVFLAYDKVAFTMSDKQRNIDILRQIATSPQTMQDPRFLSSQLFRWGDDGSWHFYSE